MSTGKKGKKKLPLSKQTRVPGPVLALEQRKLNWDTGATHASIFCCVLQDFSLGISISYLN